MYSFVVSNPEETLVDTFSCNPGDSLRGNWVFLSPLEEVNL